MTTNLPRRRLLGMSAADTDSIRFSHLPESRQKKVVKVKQINHIIAVVLFSAFTLTMACPRSTACAADPAFQVPAGERQLFLDDVDIAKIENLKRTMHKPEKKGAVIRVDYLTSPELTIQTRAAPAWDPEEKIYKLWCESMGTKGYFESPDGLSWRPGPETTPGHISAVRDPHDPDPKRRYKGAWEGKFAVSPDGIHWTKIDGPKITSSDESNFSYNSKEGLFIHTVKRSGPYGRAVAVATSRDFRTWEDHGLVFHADAEDQKIGKQRIKARLNNPTLKQTEYDEPSTYSVQIYNMGLFLYEGIYIGLPSVYHQTGRVPPSWPGFKNMHLSPRIRGFVSKHGDYTGFFNIQLVCSRDLKSWKRLGDREPFIETSPVGAGAYDVQTIIGPSAPLIRDDELWFYYTGIKQYAFITSGRQRGYDDYFSNASAICLAVLRRDGFISLDAGEEEGTVVTQPFQLQGTKLFVNVDAGNGTLRVEALDGEGTVLAASAPVKGDLPRSEVNWPEADFAGLKDKTVTLRFTLNNAQLYSYWME